MYYDGRKVKQNARDLIGMGGEILSNHYTIENSARVRKRCRLNYLRSDTPSVRGIGCSNIRLHNVLHTNRELLIVACDKECIRYRSHQLGDKCTRPREK